MKAPSFRQSALRPPEQSRVSRRAWGEVVNDNRNFPVSCSISGGARKSARTGLSLTDRRPKIKVIPGKEALSYLNTELQKRYGVTLTATGIIDAMMIDEIPLEMKKLIAGLESFRMSKLR